MSVYDDNARTCMHAVNEKSDFNDGHGVLLCLLFVFNCLFMAELPIAESSGISFSPPSFSLPYEGPLNWINNIAYKLVFCL